MSVLHLTILATSKECIPSINAFYLSFSILNARKVLHWEFLKRNKSIFYLPLQHIKTSIVLYLEYFINPSKQCMPAQVEGIQTHTRQ